MIGHFLYCLLQIIYISIKEQIQKEILVTENNNLSVLDSVENKY